MLARLESAVCGTGLLVASVIVGIAGAEMSPHDPGLRGGPSGAGGPLPKLSSTFLPYFQQAQAKFQELDGVPQGLGPTFNLNSCAGCHAQPAVGGTSPATNPQIAVATLNSASNRIPSFITLHGPVREARFIRKPDGQPDGGVHNLFTIAGRKDAPGCGLAQPDFAAALAQNNVIFRIPTPVFGAGLIEAIADSTILANLHDRSPTKSSLGIEGRPNRQGPGHVITSGAPNVSGNDGSITRFGWKAQNKSLTIFSGEAYNVEMGVTNELFPTERNETPSCLFNATPEDSTTLSAATVGQSLSDITLFATFMRFLAPPTPAPPTPSTSNGSELFTRVGCALCHTPQLMTGSNTLDPSLSNQPVNLYSDLLLHNMGPGLADGIMQGAAGPDEFRTAPLWGLGQRIFFLHDGRTSDLLAAIKAHASEANGRYRASEANAVIDRFHSLSESEQQDLLNFLRSL
jgi:CxxC motif-containing protein (DUF1111 family)